MVGRSGKIGGNTVAQVLRLADIYDMPRFVLHLINSGGSG